MSADHPEIIIIKRKANHEEGHHGGAWKIAFADFMTAMMAFFLVLWIINATDKDTKTIIARYFNPVKLEDPAKSPKGIHGSRSNSTSAEDTNGDAAKPSPENKQADPTKPGKSETPTPKSEGNSKSPATPAPTETSDAANPKPTMSETALFSDPYRSLDRIAGGPSPSTPAPAPEVGTDDPTRQGGSMSFDAFRDPFKPIGRGAVDADGDGPEADTQPPSNAGAKTPKTIAEKPTDATAAPDAQTPSPPSGAVPPAAKATPIAGATPSIGDAATSTANPAAPNAEATQPPTPAASASQLMRELQQKLGAIAKSAASPAIDVRQTDEGLLISLTDKMNYSMFAVGSAEPQRQVVQAMDAVAQTLKTQPGTIVLRGHTDARPYKSGVYDNWRLSSARAQMAYYMLTRAGVPETRVERVEGYADRSLRDVKHPLAAENRRIEILVRGIKP